MTKINKEITFFIVIIALVILWGLFTKSPINTNMPVREQQAGGLLIEFENGTTEPEVKAVLKNYNMTENYTLDYKVDYAEPNYYIMVDKDKIRDVIGESKKVKNWTEYTPAIKKGNYYFVTVPEGIINDEDFLKMIDKNNLQLKKSVWCSIHFGDGSKSWISENDAIRLKNELETNEKILNVSPYYST